MHAGVKGQDGPEVLRSVVAAIPLPTDVNRELLLQMLLARESIGSTGIGDGVAIPHARNPIVLHLPRPVVCLCYLEQPIEFGAIDGQPVHTLFTIVSPTIKTHLALLSRLAFALRDTPFAKAVAAGARWRRCCRTPAGSTAWSPAAATRQAVPRP